MTKKCLLTEWIRCSEDFSENRLWTIHFITLHRNVWENVSYNKQAIRKPFDLGIQNTCFEPRKDTKLEWGAAECGWREGSRLRSETGLWAEPVSFYQHASAIGRNGDTPTSERLISMHWLTTTPQASKGSQVVFPCDSQQTCQELDRRDRRAFWKPIKFKSSLIYFPFWSPGRSGRIL